MWGWGRRGAVRGRGRRVHGLEGPCEGDPAQVMVLERVYGDAGPDRIHEGNALHTWSLDPPLALPCPSLTPQQGFYVVLHSPFLYPPPKLQTSPVSTAKTPNHECGPHLFAGLAPQRRPLRAAAALRPAAAGGGQGAHAALLGHSGGARGAGMTRVTARRAIGRNGWWGSRCPHCPAGSRWRRMEGRQDVVLGKHGRKLKAGPVRNRTWCKGG